MDARLSSFGSARSGLAAIEFAFIAPIMLLLVLLALDTARYVIATEKVARVATAIGQMLTENATGSVSFVDLQFYQGSAMVIFPDELADAAQQNLTPWSQDISIATSSIKFTATQTPCTTPNNPSACYAPKVVWTSANSWQGGNTLVGGNLPTPNSARPCAASSTSPPTQSASATDQIVPSQTQLPLDVYGASSIIVVDVKYNFHPLFNGYVPMSVNIARSVYVAPRYVPLINYTVAPGDPGTIATVCP